jgi:hypothetical protein
MTAPGGPARPSINVIPGEPLAARPGTQGVTERRRKPPLAPASPLRSVRDDVKGSLGQHLGQEPAAELEADAVNAVAEAM